MQNPVLRPAQEWLGSEQNLRSLLALLDGWKCCGAPALCGASCQDEELSAILAKAHQLITDQLANIKLHRERDDQNGA